MGLIIKTGPGFQYVRENPSEHWDGRLYPEFMLIKMGDADNYEPDYNKQFEGSE